MQGVTPPVRLMGSPWKPPWKGGVLLLPPPRAHGAKLKGSGWGNWSQTGALPGWGPGPRGHRWPQGQKAAAHTGTPRGQLKEERMGRPPRAGTHPGGLLLGIQQGDVEGGRQAGGGEDISQGHAGFSQKPGGREHRGSAGEGAEEPHWGREQLLEIPSSIPSSGGGKRPRSHLDTAGRMLGALGLGCLPCSDNVGTSGGSAPFLAPKKRTWKAALGSRELPAPWMDFLCQLHPE